MTTRKREYSRPNGHVEKIYPLGISEIDSENKSELTKTKTIGFALDAGEAARLSVALINAIGMLSKDRKSIDATIRIHDKSFTVTVR